ncbi:MAG: RCC1 domain-containing protein, partial [Bradymonadaceae bacterium]
MFDSFERFDLVYAVVALALGFSACQSGSKAGQCGGTEVDVDGEQYCAYSKSAITETGFQCPRGYSGRHETDGMVVCSRDGDMPKGHEERVRDRVNDNRKRVDAGPMDASPDSGSPDYDVIEETCKVGLSKSGCQQRSTCKWTCRGCVLTGTEVDSCPDAGDAGTTQDAYGTVKSGNIQCWGDVRQTVSADAGTAPPFDLPSGNFQEVSADYQFACGLTQSGSVKCWGEAPSGTPNGTFTQVDVGYGYACALDDANKITCWGNDRDGQASPPSGQFEKVSAGFRYTCGLKSDGKLECWGHNADDDPTPSGTFRDVAAGETGACGIKSSGDITCWGHDVPAISGNYQKIHMGEVRICAA